MAAVLLLVVVALASAQLSSYISTDDAGNCFITTPKQASVMINEVDVVARLQALETLTTQQGQKIASLTQELTQLQETLTCMRAFAMDASI